MIGRDAFFHPAIERRQKIAFGIVLRSRNRVPVAEHVGPNAAAAMPHAGNHEQPVKIVDRSLGMRAPVRVLRHERLHQLVIIDGILPRNCRVAPAVILDELAVARAKRAQIGIGRVEQRGRFFVGVRNVGIEVQRMEISFQIFVDGLEIERIGETKLLRLCASARNDPRAHVPPTPSTPGAKPG